MSLSDLRAFFDTYKWLQAFEQGEVLPIDVTKKWEFFYHVQQVLLELPAYIDREARVSKNAEISGQVYIDNGARILPGAFIEGPTYIGKNVVVGNSALIRPLSFLSQDCIVGNHCYCTESVIAPGSGAFHFCGISRSLLEKNCRITAFVITATVKPDLTPINRCIPNEIKPPLKQGCIIGENTFIGAHVVLAPGIIIGKDCFIGPFTYINHDIPCGKFIAADNKLAITENKISMAYLGIPPQPQFERSEQ